MNYFNDKYINNKKNPDKINHNIIILDLQNKLKEANKTIEQQNLIISNLQNQLRNYSDYINKYNIILNQKESELNYLKEQLQNMKNNISINDINVKILSSDQKIDCSIPCSKNTVFAEVEAKLYEKYPQYREKDNNFVSQGQKVYRFKTIKENKIDNNIPIIFIADKNQ